MGQAIGDFLPSALGVAISPLPIIAVVLMLVTPRGRVNGPLFVVGWGIGLAIVGVIVLSVAGSVGATGSSGPATWVDWLFLVLGLGLVGLAAKQWRGRPRGDDEPVTPKWMGALDHFTPVKAGGRRGRALGAEPEEPAAGARRRASRSPRRGSRPARRSPPTSSSSLIASIGVAAPLVIYFVMGERSAELLQRMKSLARAQQRGDHGRAAARDRREADRQRDLGFLELKLAFRR